MKDLIIETKDLYYNFGTKNVLSGVSLEVPKNSIYGFIGPNGAGKTTTIRVLLSLLKVPAHKVRIFGKDISRKRIDILSRVGALIEEPSVYKHLSGYDNLRVQCRYLGIDSKRIDEVLAITELLDDKNRKVKEYSLGMRQRLSIASVLLNDPELLILDEPTNGLDPAGIHDMRKLMLKLCKEHGKTIFVSSHLLSELEKVVTHIGIIDNHKIRFQGSIQQLKRLTSDYLVIKTSDNSDALKRIVDLGFAVSVLEDKSLRVTPNSDENANKINKHLIKSGIDVYHLAHHSGDLENIFMDIVGK